MKKNKIIIITIVIALIIAVIAFIIYKGKSSNSNKINLEELIPEEVRTYKYNDKKITSEVKSVKIDRQDTDKDDEENVTYCEVELEDELLTRVVYLELELKNYDVGGWIVEDYDQYEDTVIKKWNDEKITKELVEEKINELDFKDKLAFVSKNDVSEDTIEFIYSINIDSEYYKTSGNLKYKDHLRENNDYEYEAYCMDPDISEVVQKWNIDGKYHVHLTTEEYLDGALSIDRDGETDVYFEISDSESSKIKVKERVEKNGKAYSEEDFVIDLESRPNQYELMYLTAFGDLFEARELSKFKIEVEDIIISPDKLYWKGEQELEKID